MADDVFGVFELCGNVVFRAYGHALSDVADKTADVVSALDQTVVGERTCDIDVVARGFLIVSRLVDSADKAADVVAATRYVALVGDRKCGDKFLIILREIRIRRCAARFEHAVVISDDAAHVTSARNCAVLDDYASDD